MMVWTLYQDDVEALGRLDCTAYKATEEDAVLLEDLSRNGLCEHVCSFGYKLTRAGRAVLRALLKTSVEWWNAGEVAVSFKDETFAEPAVTLN